MRRSPSPSSRSHSSTSSSTPPPPSDTIPKHRFRRRRCPRKIALASLAFLIPLALAAPVPPVPTDLDTTASTSRRHSSTLTPYHVSERREDGIRNYRNRREVHDRGGRGYAPISISGFVSKAVGAVKRFLTTQNLHPPPLPPSHTHLFRNGGSIERHGGGSSTPPNPNPRRQNSVRRTLESEEGPLSTSSFPISFPISPSLTSSLVTTDAEDDDSNYEYESDENDDEDERPGCDDDDFNARVTFSVPSSFSQRDDEDGDVRESSERESEKGNRKSGKENGKVKKEDDDFGFQNDQWRSDGSIEQGWWMKNNVSEEGKKMKEKKEEEEEDKNDLPKDDVESLKEWALER